MIILPLTSIGQSLDSLLTKDNKTKSNGIDVQYIQYIDTHMYIHVYMFREGFEPRDPSAVQDHT
jgi:hypothetical protein